MFLNIDCAQDRGRFQLDGLEIAGGTLRLVPRKSGTLRPLTPALGAAPPPMAAAGIAVGRHGRLFIADPGGDRILVWEPCLGWIGSWPGFGGHGSAPGQIAGPRGVAVGRCGGLFVVDGGNDRVQVGDPATGGLRGSWGESGTAAGQLADPWDLAVDRAGRVYVADHGNGRVQRFDADGWVDAPFGATMSAQSWAPGEPASLALVDGHDGSRLLVLDRAVGTVLTYRADGRFDADRSAGWLGLHLPNALGLAASDGVVYVGDNAAQAVRAFLVDGRPLGEVGGYQGPVAGLAVDCLGRLIVHPGGGAPVVRIDFTPGFGEQGRFLAGPFHAADRPTEWQRVRARAASLPDGAHAQIFTLVSSQPSPPPALPASPAPAAGREVTPEGQWRAAPRDALDLLARHAPAAYLWVGGVLEGDGAETPSWTGLRLEYDDPGWLRHLPAFYARDEDAADFLRPALALLRSLMDDVDEEIDALPGLFGAGSAPDGPPPSWLDWLSSWVAFPLDESWPEERRRRAVGGAFELQGRRGTVEALRRFAELYAGATILVDEPARHVGVWALGGPTGLGLGFDTTLAAGPASGAVLGTTAVPDGSNLRPEGGDSVPLLNDVAHRLCVRAYAAELPTPEDVARLRRVLDRETPAHMAYHLGIIGPALRVGLQAMVGVDAIVGGPWPEVVLGESAPLARGPFLAGEPGARPAGQPPRPTPF